MTPLKSSFDIAVRGVARPVETIREPIPAPLSRRSKGECGGGAAKTKRIIQRDANFLFPRFVRHVIEIAFRIGMLLVDGGRQDSALDSEHAESRFDRPRRAARLCGPRFG